MKNNRISFLEFKKKKINDQIDGYCRYYPPIIASDAKFFYERMLRDNRRVFRGRFKLGVIGACIINALKKHNIPYNMQHISSIINIETKVIIKAKKLVDMTIVNCSNQ